MPRPAKSEQWHELMGTQSEAAPVTDSRIPAGRPGCPKFLSPAAKKEFRRLCKALAERRVLTAGDQRLLTLAAVLHDRWLRCLEKVALEGELTQYESRDKDGNAIFREKKNLNLVIAQESEKALLGVLIQLGLTPLQKDKPKLGGHAPAEPPKPGTAAWTILHGD